MLNLFYKLYYYSNLSYNVYQYYQSYIQHNKHDIILLDKLIKYIHLCGSVMSKFCQWITPLLEIMYIEENDLLHKNRKKPLWLQKLEIFYEHCYEHDIQYTYDEYKRVFNKSFIEKYTILEILGSGSIGQVYLIEDKQKNQFVMKILHPEVHSEIQFFKRFYHFINFFPCIRKKINEYFPVDIHEFILSFEQQSDFIYEANNLLKFYNIYQNNDFIIIPQLYQVSSSILIMSYEKGTSYDDLTLNHYHKFKLVNLLNLFIRNSWSITNFNHGDIHKGNWKIKIDEENNKHKLIFYDYGFCFEMPLYNFYIIEIIIDLFESSDEDKYIDIDKISEIIYCTIISDETNEDYIKYLKKKIKQYSIDKLNDIKPWQMNPIFLVKLVIQFCLLEKVQLHHIVLQFFIISIQVEILLDEFGLKSSNTNKIKSYTVYRERYLDIIALCKTYDIFPEYKQYLQNKLNDKQPEINALFDTIDMPDSIKKIALGN